MMVKRTPHLAPIATLIGLLTLVSACNLSDPVGEFVSDAAAPSGDEDVAPFWPDVRIVDESDMSPTDVAVADMTTDVANPDVANPDMSDADMAPVDPDRWVDLTVSSGHACALDRFGGAYCWGSGANGKLGNGDTEDQALPVVVQSSVLFAAIDAGDEHTCAIDVDGFIWCWGEGEHIGAASDQLVPFQPNTAQYKHLSAGHDGVCAIGLDDQVKCWGQNDWGQLGVADLGVQVTPVDLSGSAFTALDVAAGNEITCALDLQGAVTCFGRDLAAVPDEDLAARSLVQPIVAAKPFVAIEASDADACGLTADGEIHCWGNAPFAVVAGTATTAASVATPFLASSMDIGQRFVCGLDGEGAAQCYGSNYRARMGRGDEEASPSVVTPWTPLDTNQTFKKIALYAGFGCALTNDGLIQCWGQGTHGKMGNGNLGYVAEPQLVTSAETFVQVVTADYHSCALTADGRTFCWGRGNYSALGLGDFEHQGTPTLVPTQLFEELDADGSHTCGRTAGGDIWCWGSNTDGVLGTGNQTNVNTPTQTLTAGVVTAFSTGNDHACALYAGGGTACWGDGSEVGSGSGVDVNSPSLLSTADHPAYVEISAGTNHVCGLDGAGNASCFGHNDQGELGNGSTTDALAVAAAVNTSETFKELSAGDQVTCGVTSADSGMCWGKGDMIGDGGTTRNTSPQAISGNHLWATIRAGEDHNCGITLADELFCWGASDLGQIGYGGISRQNAPRQVVLPGVVDVAPTGNHTCAVTTSGALYCWGSREFGRLGDQLDSLHRSPVYVDLRGL